MTKDVDLMLSVRLRPRRSQIGANSLSTVTRNHASANRRVRERIHPLASWESRARRQRVVSRDGKTMTRRQKGPPAKGEAIDHMIVLDRK